MTKDQDDAVFAAFLGICVLHTMCKKVGLKAAEERSAELLVEMDMAFPGLAGRSALRS